jgi:hypothetical protein
VLLLWKPPLQRHHRHCNLRAACRPLRNLAHCTSTQPTPPASPLSPHAPYPKTINFFPPLAGARLLPLMDPPDASDSYLNLPKAKVFRPTQQEWSDPNRYLSSISHLVQPDGIAKIIPPANWRPSFNLPPQLRFPAKIQLLSELDGKSRSRRVFHEQLDLLCRKIGNDPLVLERMFRGSSLGVYDLWLLVLAGGGYDKVSASADFWQEQARSAGGGIEADELKLVYAQYLLPFDQRFSLQPALAKSSSASDASAVRSSATRPPPPPLDLAASLHKFSKIAKQEARHSDYTPRDYLADVTDALNGTALLYDNLARPSLRCARCVGVPPNPLKQVHQPVQPRQQVHPSPFAPCSGR